MRRLCVNVTFGLYRKWVEVGASLSKMKTRHGVVRFFRSEIDATELAGLVAEINCSLQAFLVSLEVVHHFWRVDQDFIRLGVLW